MPPENRRQAERQRHVRDVVDQRVDHHVAAVAAPAADE